MNVIDCKQELISKIRGTGWQELLHTFLMGSELDTILGELKTGVYAGERFTPMIKYLFRPFELCPVDRVRVIWLNPEPNHFVGSNDGLAFSTFPEKGGLRQFRNFHSEISRTIYPDQPYEVDTDLKRLAVQGNLLINMCPTTMVGRRKQHRTLWASYSNHLLHVFKKFHEAVFVLVDDCRELEEDLPGTKILVTDPFWDIKRGVWGSDVFNKINAELAKRGESPMIW